MKRFLLLIILPSSLFFGCQSANTVVGAGAITVKQAAQLIQRECGNTIPGGSCLSTSRITTDEKDELKVRLQAVQDLLVTAASTNVSAQSRDNALARADAILASIEAVLISRGIE